MYSIPTSASNKVKSATNHALEHARRTTNEALPYDGSRLPAEGPAVTGALSTPHDAILYELRGSQQIPEHTSRLRAETDPLQPPAPRLSMLPSFASERVDSQSGEGTLNGRRSVAGNVPGVVLERDALYDPATGVLAGVIIPHPTDQSNDGRSGIEFNQAKDELWCHLGKIRELQSQIAGMHVQMEGLGLNDGTRGPKRPGGVSARMASDPIGVDDWVDGGDEEPNIKAEKDTEFSHLSESFGGRKAVIDNIMDKLDDLSKALTTFHALPTPIVDFSVPASGHSTRGSQSVSPGPQSPSPPFTNPNSPAMSPPLSPVQASAKKPAQLKMANIEQIPGRRNV